MMLEALHRTIMVCADKQLAVWGDTYQYPDSVVVHSLGVIAGFTHTNQVLGFMVAQLLCEIQQICYYY